MPYFPRRPIPRLRIHRAFPDFPAAYRDGRDEATVAREADEACRVRVQRVRRDVYSEA